MGEQFAQQGAILVVTNQVHATDTGTTRPYGARQIALEVGR